MATDPRRKNGKQEVKKGRPCRICKQTFRNPSGACINCNRMRAALKHIEQYRIIPLQKDYNLRRLKEINSVWRIRDVRAGDEERQRTRFLLR